MDDRGEYAGSGSADQPLMLDRVLHENSAEYMVFVAEDVHDGTAAASKPLARLEKIRKSAIQLSDKLTKDYIWQRDGFQLEVVSRQGMVYLHGITDYGDCVEDEWLIVYMLRELTKSFPGTWARICDNDGEFLLVEAAKTVPKWLNPEMDAHRVWIHDGKLEVIPVADAKTAGPAARPNSPSISLRDAVEVIKSAPQTLVHIPSLESEAFYRLEKYPGYIATSVHYARALIPRKVAYILHDRPRSIAPASEAFYTRDPASVKRALSSSSNSDQSSLNFPPVDLVTVSVKFTKVIFAQIRGQRFSPPTSWAAEFASYVEAEVQKHATEMHGGGNEAVDKAQVMANLGMKITCGFELMAATAETSNNRIVREVSLVLDDLKEDGDDASTLPTNKEINSWKDVDREDNEAWLDIDFDDFERELNTGRRGTGEPSAPSPSSPSSKQPKWEVEPGFDTGFGDAGVQTDLRKIVSRFQAFLNDDEAGLEGAEFDDMDDDDEDDEDEDDDDDDDDDDGISLDEEEFSRMMREMMGMPADANSTATKSTPAASKSPAEATEPAAQPTKATKGANPTTAVSRNVNTHTGEDDNNDDDEGDILKLAEQFEAELRGHGALRLEPPAKGTKSSKNKTAVVTRGAHGSSSAAPDIDDDESDNDSEVDVDYNLAKNLLESFKSQEGMAGPAGNVLSMLGLSLPRDDDMEDDEDEDEEDGNTKGSKAIGSAADDNNKGKGKGKETAP